MEQLEIIDLGDAMTETRCTINVAPTFDSLYASGDSVTTPRTIGHLDARSDTLAESPSVLIVPDRCSFVLSICRKSVSIPGASTENPNDGWGFRLLCRWRSLTLAPFLAEILGPAPGSMAPFRTLAPDGAILC